MDRFKFNVGFGHMFACSYFWRKISFIIGPKFQTWLKPTNLNNGKVKQMNHFTTKLINGPKPTKMTVIWKFEKGLKLWGSWLAPSGVLIEDCFWSYHVYWRHALELGWMKIQVTLLNFVVIILKRSFQNLPIHYMLNHLNFGGMKLRLKSKERIYLVIKQTAIRCLHCIHTMPGLDFSPFRSCNG